MLDFVGGTVVHILSGGSDLVASTILGRRHDYDPQSTTAHNLPFTRLVTCLLRVAALALINTNVAAASALVTWVAIDAVRGHIAISGACTGSIVGFVVITPACGFVQLGWGLLIGGIYGALMTGLFAQKIVNSGGDDGAFYGHSVQLWYQIAGILTTIAVWTTGILFPLDLIIGIRLPHDDELAGVDIADIKLVFSKFSLSYTTFNCILYKESHGENWEVTATRAAANLVDKMRELRTLAENGGNYQQDNGTFELSYKPTNADTRPIIIQYSTLVSLSRLMPPMNFNLHQDHQSSATPSTENNHNDSDKIQNEHETHNL
ncbi:unnamed protein product [Rotaria magnacalcarata]